MIPTLRQARQSIRRLRDRIKHRPRVKDLLVCPICKEGLTFYSREIKCKSCGTSLHQIKGEPPNLIPAHFLQNDATKWVSRQAEMERWYDRLVNDPIVAKELLKADYNPHDSYLSSLEGTILDIGGGIGIVRHYLRPGTRYVVIDPSPWWLSRDWSRLSGAFPCLAHPLSFVRGIGECLPFPSQRFDAVLAFWSLNHVSQPETVIREIVRVLRPNGKFLAVLEDMDEAQTLNERSSGSLKIVSEIWCETRNNHDVHVQSDHVHIDEHDLGRWASDGLRTIRREWVGGYLTIEFTARP